MSHYIYLSSDDNIYPQNSGNDFVVRLSPELSLDPTQKWEVAVTEFEIVPNTGDTCFLLCADICGPSRVGGRHVPLLRKSCSLTVGNRYLHTYVRPFYVPLVKTFIDDVRVYLTHTTGHPGSFTDYTSRVTLHIRKASPFYES